MSRKCCVWKSIEIGSPGINMTSNRYESRSTIGYASGQRWWSAIPGYRSREGIEIPGIFSFSVKTLRKIWVFVKTEKCTRVNEILKNVFGKKLCFLNDFLPKNYFLTNHTTFKFQEVSNRSIHDTSLSSTLPFDFCRIFC